jgi:hypothetical protein
MTARPRIGVLRVQLRHGTRDVRQGERAGARLRIDEGTLPLVTIWCINMDYPYKLRP